MFHQPTMDLGVSSVPKRVESTSPWCDPARESQHDQDGETDGKDEYDECSKEHLELSARYHLSDDLDESDQLEQTKDTKSSHVLARSDR